MKRIAMVVGMYDTVPPKDSAASIQITAMNSAIFSAAFGHEVTVYAPESSDLINYTKEVGELYDWQCDVSKDRKAITITKSSSEGGREEIGTLKLRGPEGVSPYGAESTVADSMDKSVEYDTNLYELMLADDEKKPFDIIHTNYFHPGEFDNYTANLPQDVKNRAVATVHGPFLSKTFINSDIPMIAISEAHASCLKKLGGNVIGVAPHGIDEKLNRMTSESAGYSGFIGRMVELKGPHRAIAAAKINKSPLILASNVHEWEQEYFDSEISPHLTCTDKDFFKKYTTTEAIKLAIAEMDGDPPIIFVGSVSGKEKELFYGNAQAILFPISWDEPFGLIRIEAPAHGTHIISIGQYGNIKCGAVGEEMEDGTAGVALEISHNDDAQVMEEEAAIILAESLQALQQRIQQQGEENVRRSVRTVFERYGTLSRNAVVLDEIYNRVRENVDITRLPTSASRA